MKVMMLAPQKSRFALCVVGKWQLVADVPMTMKVRPLWRKSFRLLPRNPLSGARLELVRLVLE